MINKLKTPFFLIKENELNNNIQDFNYALNKYWPNSCLAYSIKTNSLPWLLEYLQNKDIIAEAVSREEYDLALMCGYQGNKIIFNGPIKSEEDLIIAFKNESIINIDSQRELDFLIKNKPYHNGNLGIRINVNPNVFSKDDIGYVDDGFRFGFSFENGELAKAIDIIKSIYGNKPFGLHLHCNSITRSLDVYRSIAKYAVHIIKEFDLTPSFIDMGGGFFGGVPGKTSADEYIDEISSVLKKCVNLNNTKLLIEPGSAIIGSVVDLYTSVLDAKKTEYANIITTDGSRIYIDPLWKKSNYAYTIKSDAVGNTEDKQIICGYTCMDHDRIMSVKEYPMLQVGDKIIYHRVGAYSMTFGGTFIRYFPEVYVYNDFSTKKVRAKFDTSVYKLIHSSAEMEV